MQNCPMFEQAIRKLYDHLYANAGVKTPAGIGVEVGKLLQTGLYLERVERVNPAFSGKSLDLRAAFARMNDAWDLYPRESGLDLADFDLAYARERLAGLVISDPAHDFVGDAVEIFRSDWAKQAGGQFFTDQYVTRLAMTLLQFDPRKGDTLLDICAGTGGFLLAGLQHIRRLVSDDAAVSTLALKSLRGQDIDAGVAAVANANLRSRLGGSGVLVAHGDSLRTTFPQVRCIATNPPFGTKITVKDPALLAHFELAGGKARAPDILFLEKNLHLLAPGGRMAVVIPYQLLSGPQARYVRAWLWRYGKVRAVIDLPMETFQPHTGTKASLVLVERRAAPTDTSEDDHDIFFSCPRWIGHDRRGNRVYDENGALRTDFPVVEKAFVEFLAGRDPSTVHPESFTVNARKVHADAGLRLNAAYYRAHISVATASPRLGDLVTRIFCPGRFKRAYVAPKTPGAVPFLGGANISELLPTSAKWLAGDDPRLPDLRVEAGWILVTRSGSTGIVASVPAPLAGAAVSEHVIRIVPDPAKLDPGVLLSVLRSRYGQGYLARGIFGSVIDEITTAHIADMPIPAMDDARTAAIASATAAAEQGRAAAIAGFEKAVAFVDESTDI